MKVAILAVFFYAAEAVLETRSKIGCLGGISRSLLDVVIGTMIFIFASPVFIIGGIIACLTVGISSLQSAYRKPKEDVTSNQLSKVGLC